MRATFSAHRIVKQANECVRSGGLDCDALWIRGYILKIM